MRVYIAPGQVLRLATVSWGRQRLDELFAVGQIPDETLFRLHIIQHRWSVNVGVVPRNCIPITVHAGTIGHAVTFNVDRSQTYHPNQFTKITIWLPLRIRWAWRIK